MILWKKTIPATIEEISALMEAMEEHLAKVDAKQRTHVSMIIEDFLVDLAEKNSEEEITLQIEKKSGKCKSKSFKKALPITLLWL